MAATFAAAELLACGAATRAPGPRNQVAPQPPSWIAGPTGPWLAPGKLRSLAALDAGRELLLLDDGRVAVLDLKTGAVDAARPLAPAVVPHATRLLELGGELYVVGGAGGTPGGLAVARIDRTTLATTPVPLEAGAATMTALAVSPDGREVVGCASSQELVIRDAAWQVVARLTGGCAAPWFVSPDEVTADLRARTVTVTNRRTGATRELAGPARAGLPRTTSATWLGSDHQAAALGRKLTITAAGREQVWPLPATTYGALARPSGAGPLGLTFGDVTVAAVDVATGDVRTAADRNLTAPTRVLARGGDVVSIAEATRRWHAGALRDQALGPVAALAAAGPGAPLWLVIDDQLHRWDDDAGAPAPVADAGACDLIDATVDEVAYTDLYDIWRRSTDGTVTRWFTYDDDAILADMDLTTDRLLLATEGGISVVWPTQARVVGLPNVGCWAPSTPAFATGAPRLALDGDDRVDVYDTDQGRHLGGLWVDGFAAALAFVGPDADTLAILLDRELVLWQVGTTVRRRWPLPVGRQGAALDVSLDGREVALGFTDGAVMWIGMDELLRDSAELLARRLPAGEPCDDGPPPVDDIDTLRGEPASDDSDDEPYADTPYDEQEQPDEATP